jgi:protocatechuate 3,4-dioxygenase alpha subunit
MKLVPAPSQTVGPFFHYGLDRPEWADLTGGGRAKGERIRIAGIVRDGDGALAPDILIEIWQANAAGKYDHPEDMQEKPIDAAFRGFGRVCTGKDGSYAFTTVKPGRVPGRGNTLQAPHINMTVFARGLLRHLSTRVYFADETAANETDPVLGTLEDAASRATLLAPREAAGGGTLPTYRFDIVLQGKGETVFFEL